MVKRRLGRLIPEVRRMLHEEAALRCPCGYGIRYELRRYGERLGALAFFDDEEASETRGERITRCPACGRRIEFQLLSPRYRPDQARAGTSH